MTSRIFRIFCVVSAMAVATTSSLAQEPQEYRALAREILAELVAIETTEEAARTVEAAEAVAQRLLAAGFPEEDVRILGPRPDLGNLVLRYRGDGTAGEPIMLMAHMDVVPAVAEAWGTDPFGLTERDGYLYGRGSGDNKAGVATIVTNFLRWKAEGWVPSRDLVAVITADEETTGESIAWLLEERRDLVDAEYALNTDGGGGVLRNGVRTTFSIDAAEKIYASYRITATNPGGHSSVPGPDNAIYDLGRMLVRMADYRFPIRVNDITRDYLLQTADDHPPEVAADMRAAVGNPPDLEAAERLARGDPHMNALLRTTCVATMLEAGHAENALPREASATINCRVFPGEDPQEVESTLRELMADPEMRMEGLFPAIPSPPSFLTPRLREVLSALVEEMFPGADIVSGMATGASDGLFTRNAGTPTYTLSAIFEPEGENRAHGLDERVGVEEFHDAVEFWYRMVKRLAG
jgi:acetylornithine deacetylase/succinyl-diaminopimelate desuccinylase-like protein